MIPMSQNKPKLNLKGPYEFMFHYKDYIFDSKFQLGNIWGDFKSFAFNGDWVLSEGRWMKNYPYLVFGQKAPWEEAHSNLPPYSPP